MLVFLIEIVVSAGICGALAYFLLLSAPVDELGGSAVDIDGLPPPQKQKQPDTWWAPLVPWNPRSPFNAPYRYILANILHMDDPMTASYFDGGDSGGLASGGGADVPSMLPGVGGRGLAAPPLRPIIGRRGRRLRGCTDAGYGGLGRVNVGQHPPQQISPLRRESTHWVSVLLRWLGILVLGGGTTSHEVWSDRVRCGVQHAILSVNTAWEQKMRRREGQQQQRSRVASGRDGSISRRPLVQLAKMELGTGTAREPLMGTGTAAGEGSGSTGVGGAQAVGGPAVSAVGSGGSGSLDGSFGGGGNSQQQQRDVDEGSGGLSSSIGAAALPSQQLQQHQQPSQGQPQATSAPTVGVVLPRVAGDIVSVEIPFFAPVSSGNCNGDHGGPESINGSPANPAFSELGSQTRSSPLHSDNTTTGAIGNCSKVGSRHSPLGTDVSLLGRPSHGERTTLTPVPSPLRCFCVPIVYEDSRFLLRANCCLPLIAFLPAALAIPADVLCIECDIAIRRVSFHGALYAAFHGPNVELSFLATPQFTAHFEVARPASRGGRIASSATTTSAFIATSTMLNVVSAGTGGIANLNAGARMGLVPPLAPHNSSSNASGGGVGPGSQAPQQQRHQQGQGQGAPQLSPAAERNEKVQEMVLLAVKRSIESITYPQVLQGHINLPGCSTVQQQQQQQQGALTWSRKTASLPLYT